MLLIQTNTGIQSLESALIPSHTCSQSSLTFRCNLQWLHPARISIAALFSSYIYTPTEIPMNEQVIIQLELSLKTYITSVGYLSHMIPQDTYSYCDFELDISSLVLVWRLVFIHQHQGFYKFSRHYVYTYQGYPQFIWRLVRFQSSPLLPSWRQKVWPHFFFLCSGFYTTDNLSLGGLPCSLLTYYGRIGVFWHIILFPNLMLIQATSYLFFDRATTSWYSEVQALEVEEPSPWMKWVLIQPHAFLHSSSYAFE